MTRVKICGVTTAEDVAVAVEAGADAVGVICDVPVDTPREVSVMQAASLIEAVPPFVTAVLVTMPDGPRRGIELVETIEPDAVQIHGGFTPGDLAYVRANVDARVLYTVGADAIDSAATYDDVADALVIDSVDEDGGGGTGNTHDWDHTRKAITALSSPIVLAGGLTPENVSKAVDTVQPFAVDVSSGVEHTGGSKDPDAVRSFVARASSRDVRARVHP